MTDLEIFKLLYDLEPVNKQQEKKLNKMMSIILEKTKPTQLDEFFKTLSLDEVADKRVKRVYQYYCLWCKEMNCNPETITVFGRKVCETYNVKSVIIREDGEVYRVYRMDA